MLFTTITLCLGISFIASTSADCSVYNNDRSNCEANGCTWNPHPPTSDDYELCDMEGGPGCCAEALTTTGGSECNIVIGQCDYNDFLMVAMRYTCSGSTLITETWPEGNSDCSGDSKSSEQSPNDACCSSDTTTEEPLTTTQEPVTTTEEPVTTTKAPETTTEEPVTTEDATTTDVETTWSETTEEGTTTPSPTSCFNVIHDWIIDDIGKSSQFRFRSQCSGNQFLKIKMVSLIEYDSSGKQTKHKVTSFASQPHQNWYWIESEDSKYDGYDATIKRYVANIEMDDNEVGFNLTTILFYENGTLDDDKNFGENTLKWTTDIDSWPFIDDGNTLELCINVMTNAGNKNKNNDDGDDNLRFTFNDFEFRLEDTAFCGDEETARDISVWKNQKNNNHLDICFTFDSCHDVINHDPFIRYIYDEEDNGDDTEDNGDNDESLKEEEVVGISLGVGVSVLVLILMVFIGGFYYKKNRKLKNNLILIKEGGVSYNTV